MEIKSSRYGPLGVSYSRSKSFFLQCSAIPKMKCNAHSV